MNELLAGLLIGEGTVLGPKAGVDDAQGNVHHEVSRRIDVVDADIAALPHRIGERRRDAFGADEGRCSSNARKE